MQTFSAFRSEFESRLTAGESLSTGKLPQSATIKDVVAEAIAAARRFNHNYVGSEHVLFALASIQGSKAQIFLAEKGFSSEKIREKIAESLSEIAEPSPLSSAQIASPSALSTDVERYRSTRHQPVSLLNESVASSNEHDAISLARLPGEAPAYLAIALQASVIDGKLNLRALKKF